MTLKQFRRWGGLGIVLLAMIGCGRAIKSPPTTAVSPTFARTTATPSEEVALDLETPVSTTPTATATSYALATPVPIAIATVTATSIPYNYNLVTPEPPSAAELQATIIANPQDSYTSILIRDNLAYLGYGDQLLIVDISTPSQPTLVSEIRLQAHMEQFQVIGNTLYIVLRTGNNMYEWPIELHIVDVTDPTNPSKLGSYKPAFLAADAVVIGNVAHVIGYNDDWEVVDISNPNSPTQIGTIREGWTGGCSGCNTLYDVREMEGYLHLFTGRNRNGLPRIAVYDVANPLLPKMIRELSYSNGNRMILDYSDADEDAYTFIPTHNEGNFFFRILDISSQGGYNVVGELVIEVPGTYIQAGGFVAVGHYVYFASSDGFYIIDVVNRFRPSLANTLYPKAYFSDIVKANSFVYLLDWNNGLIILDVSDPLNPAEVGKWQR